MLSEKFNIFVGKRRNFAGRLETALQFEVE
jgi:hypothetical protein